MQPTARSTRSIAAITVAAVIAAFIVLVPADLAGATTPSPTATLSVPGSPFIGSGVTAQISFSNNATTAIGFGPYVDLFTDSTGADGDDGVSFVSATSLGVPVTAQTITLACNGSDTHPLTGLALTCPTGIAAGDTMTVMTLPFGSFAPAQPAAGLSVSLQVSPNADLGHPLGVVARGGFRFGADPLDNPAIDPPIVQPTPTVASMSPTVMTLGKTVAAPESETATGANYRRSWTVTANVAPGQTVTDLVLTDRLPPTVAYDGVDSLSPGGVVVDEPPTSDPQLPPDNEVTAEWATANSARSMTLGFWVPRLDASGSPVLSPSTGAAASIPNNASLSAIWTPLDPRDTPAVVEIDPNGAEATITARSIATQKSAQVVNDVGATGPSPGDTLEWTIEVQVSDYFTFDAVTLSDVLSDGQSLDASFTPTMSVSTPSGSGPVADFADYVSSSVSGCGAAVPGGIEWNADLSAALLDGLPASAGRFVGREAAATTATVRLRTVIDTDYRCPPGASVVNSGDRITNSVTVGGAVVDAGVVGPTVTDSSSAGVTIVAPSLSKVVYALNGDPSASGDRIAPGDVVTYRIRTAVPITNVFGTELTDFLPLPTFDLPPGGLTTYFAAAQPPGAFSPVPWSITRGPDDTFTGASEITGADPALSIDQVNNSFTLDYPDYQGAPGDSAETIDLLVNVVASEQRFADGLFLTNQVSLTYADSRSVTSSSDAVAQVQLTEPRLEITKGVVRTDRAGATFSPSQVGPSGISWSAPGSAGTRFSGGSITSSGLAANGIGSSLSGVDAGDAFTYAIVVENTGSGLNGAFDVGVTDVLPAGVVEPSGGWNLRVTDGTGAALGFTTSPGAGPLGAGITLNDAPGDGSLAAYSAGSGRNLAVITFDAVLPAGAAYSATYTNTAAVPNYSATEGGPNFVTSALEATANVLTANPDLAKVITATEMVPGTSDVPPRSTLTIGSLVSFDLTMTVPEGTANAVTLRDTLAEGLAVVSVDAISASPALSTSVVGGFPAVLAGATVSSVGSGASSPGRRVTLDFATLTNNDNDNATAETVTVSLTAVVLNIAANTPITATTRNNAAQAFVGATAVSPSRVSPSITIVGPRITTTKVADVAAADAGDTVTYTLTLTATSTPRVSDAYDVTLADVLPAGVTLVPGSFTHTGGVAPATLSGGASPLGATWPVLAPGQTSTFTYSVVVNDNAASFGATAVNTATARWSTQPADPGSQSTFNTLGVQRTGDTLDVGGSANNLNSTATASVVVNQASVTKAIEATSAAHTTGSSVTIGETVSYSLTVELPEGELGQVTVTDLLPAGLVADAGSVAVDSSGLAGSLGTVSSQVVGNNVVVTFSAVNVDSSPSTIDNVVVVTLDAVVADVPGNVSGTVLNNRGRVTIGGSQFDSALVPVTVVVPALTVVKSVAPTSAAVNDEVTYTFVVTNTGTSSAFDVELSDLVDSGVLVDVGSFTGPVGWTRTSTPSGDDTEVRWTSATGLGVGANASFSFTATVADTITFPGTHVNTASVSGSSLPGSPSGSRVVSDDDDATLSFTAVDLAVEKTASVATAEAGETIEYTIAVTNEGGRGATDVELVDTLGEFVEFVSASDSGTHDAGVVTWPVFDLAAGATREFTVTVAVISPLPVTAAGTTNTVEVTEDGTHGPDSDPSNNSDTATVTLNAAVDLSVAKSVTQSSVAPGGTLDYRVSVENLGNRDAEDATVVDTLGAHLVFVSASGGGVWDPDDRTITWTGVDLGGGESVDFDVEVTVAATVPAGTDEVGNSATASHPDDVNPDNDSDSVTTPVTAAPDLAITKTNGQTSMLAGQSVTYTIEVTNLGDRGASSVSVVDSLPVEVDFVSASDDGVHDGDEGTVSWMLGTIEPGEVRTLTLVVTAQSPLPDGTVSVTNTVEVADDGANGTDPDLSNNTASDTDVTGADLSVTKVLDGESLTPGASATYRITVANAGPETVTEMTFVDTLPTGLVATGFTPSAGTFDPDTGRWSGLSLAPGQTVVMVLTVDVALSASGSLTNTVTVTPIGPADPTPEDATDSTTDPVVALVDLLLTKVLDTELVRGEIATYTLTVLNRGPSNASGIVVVDQLPAALGYEGFSGEGWNCGVTGSSPRGGPEVSCAFSGTLAPGEQSSVRIDTRVAADAQGEIANLASVSSVETDTDPETLVASATATMPPRPTPPGGGAGPSGTLPFTGSDPSPMLLFGLALLAAGAALQRRWPWWRRAGLLLPARPTLVD